MEFLQVEPEKMKIKYKKRLNPQKYFLFQLLDVFDREKRLYSVCLMHKRDADVWLVCEALY